MKEAYPRIEETEVFAEMKKVMETRFPAPHAQRIRLPDGRRGWFDMNILPWQDGIMILSLDVTAAKNAE